MKFLKRSIVQRLAGTCITPKPVNDDCWRVRGNQVEVSLKDAAELSRPSGALRLEGKGLEQRILIVHGEDGEFHAYPNHCPHAGRRLDPMPGEAMLQCCSLGKSTFDYSGKVLYGEDTTAIHPLPLRREKDRLVVVLS
jgi:nitrite reductase/ring-hydroxylating ferredoxin subunit